MDTRYDIELKEIEKNFNNGLLSKDEYKKKIKELVAFEEDVIFGYSQEIDDTCPCGEFDSEPDYREL